MTVFKLLLSSNYPVTRYQFYHDANRGFQILILGFKIGLNQILREELLIALLASDHDMVVRSLTDI